MRSLFGKALPGGGNRLGPDDLGAGDLVTRCRYLAVAGLSSTSKMAAPQEPKLFDQRGRCLPASADSGVNKSS